MHVMAHPFRLMLEEETAKELSRIAELLKDEEQNYQIGVGTVAARLLESLKAHPELITKLLNEYKPSKEEQDPFVKSQSPAKKKAA